MKIEFKKSNYVRDIIKKYPKVASGRKNFEKYNDRIRKTLKIIKKYYSKTNN